MYIPYLRGKQFELEALLEIPATVYRNTLPIIEPVNVPKRRFYERLAAQRVPIIITLNPYYPVNKRLTIAEVQGIITSQMPTHLGLVYGFLIDQRFNIAEFNTFLNNYSQQDKAIIFRFNPLHGDLTAIRSAISTHPATYVIFDDRRTNQLTRNFFATHNKRILITDGFQRQDRNADYPAISAFESNYSTYRSSGWWGIGDYLSIGDYYQEGGGAVYVITLHVTTKSNPGLIVHHFSSTIYSTIKGLPAPKFAEANGLLVASPSIIPLASTGLDLFRDWEARGHNPQLGAAKKASIMHHIELMSRLV
jgi:hypothetical protein